MNSYDFLSLISRHLKTYKGLCKRYSSFQRKPLSYRSVYFINKNIIHIWNEPTLIKTNYLSAFNLHQRSSAVCSDLGEGKMIDGVEKIHFAACWGLFDNASCPLSGSWWPLMAPNRSWCPADCRIASQGIVLLLSSYTSFHLFCLISFEWLVIWVLSGIWELVLTYCCLLVNEFSHTSNSMPYADSVSSKSWLCFICFISTLRPPMLRGVRQVKIIIQTINKHALKWVVNKSQYDLFVFIQMSYNFAYNIFLGRNENMPVTGEFNNDKIIRGKYKSNPFCCPSYGALFMHVIFLRYLPTA